jgi:hypothetical protein
MEATADTNFGSCLMEPARHSSQAASVKLFPSQLLSGAERVEIQV